MIVMYHIRNLSGCGKKNTDSLVVYDINDTQQFLDLVTRPSCQKTKSDIPSPLKTLHIRNVISYQNRYDCNFRHFTKETMCLLRHAIENKEIYVLVCPNRSSHTTEMLNIFSTELSGRIIILDSDTELVCKRLIVPPTCKRDKDGIDHSFIKLLVQKCTKREIFPKRICLDRRSCSSRKVTNIEVLNKFVKDNDLVWVVPESMSLKDQIATIHHADVVISIIGAGCENALFRGPKTKFIVLTPDFAASWASQYRERRQYAIGKQKVSVVICGSRNPKSAKTPDPLNAEWIIDEEHLRKIGI